MKPLSLIALFIAVGLIILGIAARGQGSERVLSTAVIFGASLIVVFIVVVRVIMFFKKNEQ